MSYVILNSALATIVRTIRHVKDSDDGDAKISSSWRHVKDSGDAKTTSYRRHVKDPNDANTTSFRRHVKVVYTILILFDVTLTMTLRCATKIRSGRKEANYVPTLFSPKRTNLRLATLTSLPRHCVTNEWKISGVHTSDTTCYARIDISLTSLNSSRQTTTSSAHFRRFNEISIERASRYV